MSGEDAGPADAGFDGGSTDAGVVDAGFDGGSTDAGVADAGRDGGATDAGIVDRCVYYAVSSDAGVVDGGVVIDFAVTSAQFPPTVNKIGFNSVWNSTNNDNNIDSWVIRRSAAYRAPMIAALIEPKTLLVSDAGEDLYKEAVGEPNASELDVQQCSLWSPGFTNALFARDGGSVVARRPTDPDLAGIRTLVQDAGLMNFLQLAGTPGLPRATPLTSTFNGLFTLEGQPTTGGNWYPMPIAAEVPQLASAFGSLPDALGYGTPTIFSFWQEPSHTIDEAANPRDSIRRYTNLYALTANEVLNQCRWQHCPMGGAQLNGNDGDLPPPYTGFRYRIFIDELLAKRDGGVFDAPLDYFTIQNYGAQWNDNVMGNARVALGSAFPWTPVLMNEWDYCVNPRAGDGCVGNVFNSSAKRFDGCDSLAALRLLLDTVDRPDLSHVLLTDKVLKAVDRNGAVSYPWTQVPILFLASMSEFRRPASTGLPEVPIVASGDSDQLRILMWNEGSVARTVPLQLRNIPSTLVTKRLFVKKISSSIREALCPAPADVMDANHVITCWQEALSVDITSSSLTTSVVVGPGEAVMVFAGTPPAYSSSTFSNNYVRSTQLVPRDGGAGAPLGMGHFDPRTGSLTVSVRAGGVGVATATLKNVTNTLRVTTRLAASGTVAPQAIAGIRVDYLNNQHAVLKTAFFRDSRWATAPTAPVWAQFAWPASSDYVEASTNLCGTTCTNGDGTDVTLNLNANAPASWVMQNKDIVIGVVLAGTATDTIYRVDLP